MIVLSEGCLTEKCNNSVGHFNIILVRGGRNLNNTIFRSSNAQGLPGAVGRGMLKFHVDWCITIIVIIPSHSCSKAR